MDGDVRSVAAKSARWVGVSVRLAAVRAPTQPPAASAHAFGFTGRHQGRLVLLLTSISLSQESETFLLSFPASFTSLYISLVRTKVYGCSSWEKAMSYRVIGGS